MFSKCVRCPLSTFANKVDEFFSRPVKAIEENLKNFQTQDDKTVYCSLALLVVVTF
jgi:hypothetical protein